MAHKFMFPILSAENYDGDSFNLTLDLGFSLVTHQKCRLEGVDTPELRDAELRFKAHAERARGFVRGFLAKAVGGAGLFVSHTYTGKYGRPLGDILLVGGGGGDLSLRDELLNGLYGVPYSGESKDEIRHLHLKNIEKWEADRANWT